MKATMCLFNGRVYCHECRILQYGQMSMSSEVTDGGQTVTKADVEAVGDQGLLNLLIDDTVFYVGGYPKTFLVSTWKMV